MTTPILGLGELAESQASKYITINTALRKLECITIRVLSQSNSGPPGSPSDGDAYIVDVQSGAWSAFPIDDIAYYSNTSWYSVTPKEGYRVWVVDDVGYYVYHSSAWVLLAAPA
jgi:hypothetical protein